MPLQFSKLICIQVNLITLFVLHVSELHKILFLQLICPLSKTKLELLGHLADA